MTVEVQDRQEALAHIRSCQGTYREEYREDDSGKMWAMVRREFWPRYPVPYQGKTAYVVVRPTKRLCSSGEAEKFRPGSSEEAPAREALAAQGNFQMPSDMEGRGF